ncbi:MAG: DUF5681 domain-containing protein [Amphiplicatus sp.]
MSDTVGKIRKSLREGGLANDEYEVGYAKPPTRTRFKPGVSGNPKGRPRGAKNRPPALNEERLKDIIIAEAYRTIEVREGAKNVTYPIAQAVIRSLAVNAVKGQLRAQELFTELLSTTERAHKRLHDEYLDAVLTYKVEWERELEDRKRTGRTGPEPVPHPDDLILDMRTGQIICKGPWTKEEKAKYDQLRAKKLEFQEEIVELRQMLRDAPEKEHRRLIEDEIQHDERIVTMISQVIPD